MTIDKSDFDNWLENPITKDVLQSTKARRECILSALIYDNRDIYEPGDSTYKRMLVNKGRLFAYDELLNIRYDDFIQENKSNE